MNGFERALSSAAPWLVIIGMCAALIVLLIRFFLEPAAPGVAFAPLLRRLIDGKPLASESPDDASTANRRLRRRLRKNEWAFHAQVQLILWVICIALLSRLVILASAMVGCWLNGNLLAFFSDFRGHWVRWDAIGYLSVANNGYTEANQAYMVLMPLYPLLTRILSYPLLGNAALAGTIISNISLVGAGWALYLLVQERSGQIAAKKAVQLMMFCPLSVFFSVPYAESLFLFLTLLSILLARRQKFVAAVCVGALASFTRLAGLLTMIPIFLEVLKYEASIRLWPRHKGRCVARLAVYSLLTLLVSAGFFAYLLVNKIALGDPFAFVRVQADYWNQTFGSLANTLKYSLETAFTGNSIEWTLGVWGPQSLAIILAVLLLMKTCVRCDPGDGLYAWLYLSLTLASTWLLTGPRMILCMYPLYPMLTQVTRRKGLYAFTLVAFTLMMIFCSYMYAVVGNLL